MVLGAPLEARAAEHYLVLGPSAAFIAGGGLDAAPAVSLDLTYGYVNRWPIFWASLGCRFAVRADPIVLPYAEVGASLPFNLGLGYSAAFGATEEIGHHFFHLFVGAPIPIFYFSPAVPLLIEPYYRPAFGKEVVHEAGLLVKYLIPVN